MPHYREHDFRSYEILWSMTITYKSHKSLGRQNIHSSSFFTQIILKWLRNMPRVGEGVSIISIYKDEEGKKHLSMEHRQCNYKGDRPKLLKKRKKNFSSFTHHLPLIHKTPAVGSYSRILWISRVLGLIFRLIFYFPFQIKVMRCTFFRERNKADS